MKQSNGNWKIKDTVQPSAGVRLPRKAVEQLMALSPEQLAAKGLTSRTVRRLKAKQGA